MPPKKSQKPRKSNQSDEKELRNEQILIKQSDNKQTNKNDETIASGMSDKTDVWRGFKACAMNDSLLWNVC